MSYPEIEKLKDEMEETLTKFDEEVAKIQTGRANTALVEGLMVSYYGNQTPLKKVASVSITSPTQIVVQPWDKGSFSNIEAAICESDLGFGVTNDGKLIRLSIPPLTEERRKEILKILERIGEEFKVSLRNLRRAVWDEIQEKKKRSEITEDDLYRVEKELNKIIEEKQERIAKKLESKKNEIIKI